MQGKLHHCTVQNLINIEWLRYSGVFLAWINYPFLLCLHLVQNLAIIIWNVSRSYKILVNFLNSWLAHALKLAIFQWLLLLSGRQKRASKRSGMNVKIINFQLLKGISFVTGTSWDIHVWILVIFVGAD